jgi:hypothetical protein
MSQHASHSDNEALNPAASLREADYQAGREAQRRSFLASYRSLLRNMTLQQLELEQRTHRQAGRAELAAAASAEALRRYKADIEQP